ncbi:MAG: tRNA lysidine(34) synthetase TilS [Bacteroides sp.]|nr:tRNA lysidine(34) synthetase TilS [Bacillota bacterium]MCM1393603.1 tRNA lysidine(34) synthetase TilS [[Eubacterium] siraeum]MCM1455815.1 tRNA lysidine(34) synthetase TilS [Bacteroides sp.]
MADKIRISYDELLSYSPHAGDKLTVCVAVSGGRDSVALLHCLKNLRESKKNPRLEIVAVNVEHGIRGEDSIHDSEFVKKLCQNWDIPLFSYGVNATEFASANGYTLEQAGRILRYEIFDRLLDEGKCDLIALAHHLDDQAETILMRVLRGTGIRGLVGMKKVNGRYIRPLLGYDRESINDYIEDNGLNYVEDATNDDTLYTRNFLRQEVAELKKRFPKIGEAIARLSASAEEANDFIDSQVPQVEIDDGAAYINISDCENPLIAKRLILKAANALGVLQDIEERHYALVLDLLSAESGKYLTLTHGLEVHKEGDRLAFTLKADCVRDCEREFCVGDFEDLGISVIEADISKVAFGGDTLFVDADKIPQGAVIRARQDGDYIRKFGGGTKSLGDFLTDKKIPLRLRDGLKVIAKDNKIYAVFGVDVSADAKIDESTVRVYALKNLR